MEQVGPEQIAVMSGLVVSAVVWLAKWLFPKFDYAVTLYKFGPVVVANVLTVGFAKGWTGGVDLIWQMLWAVVTALIAYRQIGQPLLNSLREDCAYAIGEALLKELKDEEADPGC